MSSSVLQLVESFGGWRLLDDGSPTFWFLEKESALQTAQAIADARNAFCGIPSSVLIKNGNGPLEFVAAYG